MTELFDESDISRKKFRTNSPEAANLLSIEDKIVLAHKEILTTLKISVNKKYNKLIPNRFIL